MSTIERILPMMFCLMAAAFDLKTDRIPNRLILCGSGCAFAVQVFMSVSVRSGEGLFVMVCGGVLPLLFPGILFCLGYLGAGDVKLLCMIGLFLGPASVWRVTVLSFFAGGFIGLSLLLVTRGRRRKIHFSVPVALALAVTLRA